MLATVRKVGFDNHKYLNEQTAAILERVERFSDKLYLEFGGKIVADYHAMRVLPGFDPNVKMRLLHKLRDKAEIVMCIHAGDIERRKMRADFGITYDVDIFRMIDEYRSWELDVAAVVITRFADQPAAKIFKNKLERRGIRTYTHRFTKGYPTDVDTIVSDEGYGANEYIVTKKPLVVVTAPGPGSGKLATCLSQLYHDHKQGHTSGYAKFETFPIWNIPLNHPVNIAYEAATTDLLDSNMIDPFHLEKYKVTAVNYNRDVEVFPVLRRILKKITGGEAHYESPTDMGVNRAGFGIVDDPVVSRAAVQEVIARYFQCARDYRMGYVEKEAVEKSELLMDDLEVKPEDRVVVTPARDAAKEAQKAGKGNQDLLRGCDRTADGTIVTGKNTPLMHAASSAVLNAVKQIACLPEDIHILSPNVIRSIGGLKEHVFGNKSVSLDLEEILIALSMSATTNPTAQKALESLKTLRDCEMHITHIPTPGDEKALRKLRIHFTSDPEFATANLFDG